MTRHYCTCCCCCQHQQGTSISVRTPNVLLTYRHERPMEKHQPAPPPTGNVSNGNLIKLWYVHIDWLTDGHPYNIYNIWEAENIASVKYIEICVNQRKPMKPNREEDLLLRLDMFAGDANCGDPLACATSKSSTLSLYMSSRSLHSWSLSYPIEWCNMEFAYGPNRNSLGA